MNKQNAYTSTYTEGHRYQEVKNLSVKEIAKLVRKEVRDTYSPKNGWVISVTVDNHTSISIYIKESPIKLFNSDWATLYVEAKEDNNWIKFQNATFPYINGEYNTNRLKKFNVKAEEVIYDLKRIAEQYNFDDSDSMIDYFHVNFYVNAGVHWEHEYSLIKECVKDNVIETITTLVGGLK